MILFTKSYQVGDKVFATIEEAQAQELSQLLLSVDAEGIKSIISNTADVVNILTTSASSRPRARTRNGGKKTRKATATTEA